MHGPRRDSEDAGGAARREEVRNFCHAGMIHGNCPFFDIRRTFVLIGVTPTRREPDIGPRLSRMTDSPVCGELLHLPPMHCNKPAGHNGNHSTSVIPEPLSAVAAEMVTEHDRLLRERADFAEWRRWEVRRLRAWQFVALVTTTCAGIAVILGFWHGH